MIRWSTKSVIIFSILINETGVYQKFCFANVWPIIYFNFYTYFNSFNFRKIFSLQAGRMFQVEKPLLAKPTNFKQKLQEIY